MFGYFTQSRLSYTGTNRIVAKDSVHSFDLAVCIVYV